jgi:putative acetyltransferase
MVVIRRARPEDSEAIAEVHMGAIREICVSHYTPEEIAAWGVPRKPEFYLDAIKNKEYYVAEEGGVVVGFGTFNQESGEIAAVFVRPGVVRRGIGSQILGTLEERARELKVRDLHLKASLNAVQFYERAGYRQRNEARHRLQSGAEIPCVIMEKELAGA